VLVECSDLNVPEPQGMRIPRSREEVPAEAHLKTRRDAYEESRRQYISAVEEDKAKNSENPAAAAEVKGQENNPAPATEEKVRRQDPDAGLVSGTVDGLGSTISGASSGLGSLLAQTVGGVGSGLGAIQQGDAVGGVANILGGVSGGVIKIFL
jgi:hypothetical protein